MRALRKLASVFCGLLAVFVVLHAVVVGSDDYDRNIGHQVQEYRRVHDAFQVIAEKIDTFRQEKGRLPSEAERRRLKLSWHGIEGVPRIEYIGSNFPREAVKALGSPQQERPYLLAHWNGDYLNYYASWSGETTLPLEKSAWYVTGSRAGDLAASLATVALFLVLAWRVWPGRRGRAT